MPSMTTTPKLVIFSDLDGTLLDRNTYSFESAQPALRLIKEKGIPLILSSSKTRAEIELYRRKLENDHPFISENGGAIFIPTGYFSFQFPYNKKKEGYLIFELGIFYVQIIEVLESIKKETGIPIKGFSDLTENEIASLCGLSLKEAEFAKKREYGEPFIVEGGEKKVEIVKRKIAEKGMTYVWGGKFHHVIGENDKGKAVEMLKKLYENEFCSIIAVGIGDGLNDLSMLSAVDHPIFLKGKDDPLQESLPPIKNLTIINGTGPQAWNDGILSLLNRLKIQIKG